MSIKSSLANGKRKGPESIRGLTTVRLWLVRKKAGEGLSEVANGLGLCLVLAVTSGARDPAEERGVAEGVEGIGQGLGLTGKGGGGGEKEREGSKWARREGRKDGVQGGMKDYVSVNGVSLKCKDIRQTGKCVRGPKSHKHNICTKIFRKHSTILALCFNPRYLSYMSSI